MKKKDLVSLLEWDKEEIIDVFKVANEIKRKLKNGEKFHPLEDKQLGMIFQKSSTRTRVSFQVGISQLGGAGLFLSGNDLQIGRGESIRDTALTLSRYLDCIMIRTFDHNDVIELAKYATIPVINGLTNLLHPCQVLTDVFTMVEHLGDVNNIEDSIKGLNLVYIGDGNNMANSLIAISAKLGINIYICCPKGYEPDKDILEKSEKFAKQENSKIEIINKLDSVLDIADVYYTDVWVSMGQEKEEEERLKVFKTYQINQELINKSKKNVKIMHCLPAHLDKEITEDAMYGKNSIIFDQAENRLHTKKAVMYKLILKK